MKMLSFIFQTVLLSLAILRGDDFYTIGKVTYRDIPGNYEYFTRTVEDTDSQGKQTARQAFAPFFKVEATTKGKIRSDAITARVYFYDLDGKMIDKTETIAGGGEVYVQPETVQTLYFIPPDDVLKTHDWTALIIFGDDRGIDAQSYPRIGEETSFDYPESKLYDRNGAHIDRTPALDPVTEYVVNADHPTKPRFEMFMRLPMGVNDPSKVKGVIALSLLADSLIPFKRNLQDRNAGNDAMGMLKYADDHQFMVICWPCWGNFVLWDPRKNWDEQSPDQRRLCDTDFDQQADAWEQGIQHFIKEYGIPSNNYLLWGESASAQFDCRLALRKPDYFLAARINIESSYDEPTLGGNRVLWCLTTGELESGYQRSLRFYAACRKLGYPMIYKAIPGIGHQGTDVAQSLGEQFFDYALTLADQRRAYDQATQNPFGNTSPTTDEQAVYQPWPEAFRKPAYVGDVVNQEMFPVENKDMVPLGFRTPLPTKDLAETWNQ